MTRKPTPRHTFLALSSALVVFTFTVGWLMGLSLWWPAALSSPGVLILAAGLAPDPLGRGL